MSASNITAAFVIAVVIVFILIFADGGPKNR